MGTEKFKAPHMGAKTILDSVQINNQGFFRKCKIFLPVAVVISAST